MIFDEFQGQDFRKISREFSWYFERKLPGIYLFE